MIFKGSLKRTGLATMLLAGTAIVAPAALAAGNTYATLLAPATSATQVNAVATATQGSLYDYAGGNYYPAGVAGATGLGTSQVLLQLQYGQAVSAVSNPAAFTVFGGTAGVVGNLPLVTSTALSAPANSGTLLSPSTVTVGAPIQYTADTTNKTVAVTLTANEGNAFGCFNGYVGVASNGSVQQLLLQINNSNGAVVKTAAASTTAAGLVTSALTPVGCGEARPVQVATYNKGLVGSPDSVLVLSNHTLVAGTGAPGTADFSLFADNHISGANDSWNHGTAAKVATAAWSPIATPAALSGSVLNPTGSAALVPFASGFQNSTAWDGTNVAGSAASNAVAAKFDTSTVGQVWLTGINTKAYTYVDVFDNSLTNFGKLKPLTLGAATGLSASIDGAVPVLLSASREFTGKNTGVLALTFSEPVSLALSQLLTADNSLLISTGLSGANPLSTAILPATALKTATGSLGADLISQAGNTGLNVLNGGWGVIGTASQNLSATDKLRNGNTVVFDIQESNANYTVANNNNYLNGYSTSSLGVTGAFVPAIVDDLGNTLSAAPAPVVTNIPSLPAFVPPNQQANLREAWPVFNSQGQVTDILVYANTIITTKGPGSIANHFTINVASDSFTGTVSPVADGNNGTHILASGHGIDLPLPAPLANLNNPTVTVTYDPASSPLVGGDPSQPSNNTPVAVCGLLNKYSNPSDSCATNDQSGPIPDNTLDVSGGGNNGNGGAGLFSQLITGQVQKRLNSADSHPGAVVGVPGTMVRADLAYFDKGRTLPGTATGNFSVVQGGAKVAVSGVSVNTGSLCISFSDYGVNEYNNGQSGCGGLLSALDAQATAGNASLPGTLWVNSDQYGNVSAGLTSASANNEGDGTPYPVTISTTATTGGFAFSNTAAGISGLITLQNSQPYLNIVSTVYGSTDINGNYALNVATSSLPPGTGSQTPNTAPFVLISVQPGGFTNGEANAWQLATYADQSLANYVQFKPDITSGTAKTPSTNLANGAGANGATVQNIRVDLIGQSSELNTMPANLIPNPNYVPNSPETIPNPNDPNNTIANPAYSPTISNPNNNANYTGYSTNWQLFGLPGNIARSSSGTSSFQVPLLLTSIDPSTGAPFSLWYNQCQKQGPNFQTGNGWTVYNGGFCSSGTNIAQGGFSQEAFVLTGSVAAADFSLDGGLTNAATIGKTFAGGLGLAVNLNSYYVQNEDTQVVYPNNRIFYPLSETSNVAAPTAAGTGSTPTAISKLVAANTAQPATLPSGWSLVTFQGAQPIDPSKFGTGTSTVTGLGQVTYQQGAPNSTKLTMIIQADDFNSASTWLASSTAVDYTQGDQTGTTTNTVGNTLTTLNPGQAYFVYAPAAIAGFTFQ